MTQLLIHKLMPGASALVCGTTHGRNLIFGKEHGGSMHWSDVTCPDCRRIGGMECEDEGCEHYGTPHTHTEKAE